MNKYLITAKATEGELALAKQSFFLLNCENDVLHYVQSQISSVFIEEGNIYIQVDPNVISNDSSSIETNLFIDSLQRSIHIYSPHNPIWLSCDEVEAISKRALELLT